MLKPIELTPLSSTDLDQIDGIDRSESVERMYRRTEDGLELFERNLFVPADPAFWERHRPRWAAAIESGAKAFGAYDAGALCGFVILAPLRERHGAQILALYVSAEHRMSGIAKSLYLEAKAAAIRNAIQTLYVSAPPTHTAVSFYLHQGFELAQPPLPGLEGQASEDIVLVKRL